jgi:transglutaminase-like putative cysteine protease
MRCPNLRPNTSLPCIDAFVVILYTHYMQKKQSRGLDWLSVVLIFLLIQAASTRLVVTRWTEFLIYAQSLSTIGILLGLALGYSQFKRKSVVRLALGYSLTLIPWQFTMTIQGDVLLSEKLISVGGRLLFSLGQLFRREVVEDGLLFVAFITIVLWCISLVSGYFWARHQNYLVSVLPAGIFILIIQLYDSYDNPRIILVGIYLLLALILLGRVYYLNNRESWRARRVFQIQETTYDLTRGLIIAATIFVVVAWTIPTSAAGWQSAVQTWTRFTKPWRDFQDWFSNAVEALESSGRRSASDFYSARLNLGLGTPLADMLLFTVKAPAVSEYPPRYYWRGFVYDIYEDNQWYNSFALNEGFEPSLKSMLVTGPAGRGAARFTITTRIKQSLLYIPTRSIWVSRPGLIRISRNESGQQDIAAWFADPALAPGERFEVEAELANPSIEQLQAAGNDYPAWVLEDYLRLPQAFSPSIRALAEKITQARTTPYDKTAAITNYLRHEIAYANPLPEPPPEDADVLEWMLFKSRLGFCNYYATAEVTMLRSIGIPARMAVGFAEGEYDPQDNSYTVRSLDAHAWPEVYFPDIGWIEFEPTVNQEALVRPKGTGPEFTPAIPKPQERLEELGALNPIMKPDRKGGEEAQSTTPETVRLRGWNIAISIAATVLIAVLLWGLNRQYTLAGRLSIRLQAIYEHNGGQAPAWIINWARWNSLSPIEQSYETINRCLRLLGKTPAVHATPTERSTALAARLPNASRPIKTLVTQHQASLFSAHPGRVRLAKRASFAIWVRTFQALFKELMTSLKERISGSGSHERP